MSVTIPTKPPTSFTAGETVTLRITDSDYPASAGALSFFWVNAAGAFTQTSSTADGDTFVIVVDETDSSVAAGTYSYQARYVATSDSAETVIRSGATVVKPEFSATAFDNRSFAKKTLDALEAVMEGRASEDQLSMSIQGRSVQKMSLEEIIVAIEKLRSWVRQEESAESIANGLGNPNVIRTRF